MTTEIIEIAHDILFNTRDGTDLHYADLQLIEMAINGNLNESGIEEVMRLHRLTDSGIYDSDNRWLEG